MEPEGFPRSHDQDEPVDALPPSEAIGALLQAEIEALKQVELAGAQLLQAFQRQTTEVEALGTLMKHRRALPKHLKRAYREQYWWRGMSGEIRAKQEAIESYCIFLEMEQQTYRENVSAFKRLKEEVDALPPR